MRQAGPSLPNLGAPAAGPSRRTLLALTLAVGAVHGLLLWGTPALLPMGDGPAHPQDVPGHTFSTRRIEARPAVAPRPPQARIRTRPHVVPPPAMAEPSSPIVETVTPLLPEPPTEADDPTAAEAPGLVASAPATGQTPTSPVAAGPDPGPATKVPATDQPATEDHPSVSVPPPMRLGYTVHAEVRHLPYQANGEMSWTHDGSHYQAKASISVFLIGSRTQTSEGDITATGLAPRRFSDKARSEQAAHFNAAEGKVSFSANTPDVMWLPGMQDRLSLFMQLAALVAADPSKFAGGTRITLPTVSARDADTWVFQVDGPEELNLSSGAMGTLKLTRAPRAEHDTRVELWLSPALHYLPARIRITQSNGNYVDQQLHEILTP